MPHNPEHKALVDSIIDQEIDTANFVKEVVERYPKSGTAALMKAAMRRIVAMRLSNKITVERAKELMREAFRGFALFEYVNKVERIRDLVDKHVEEQHKQIAAHGKSLRSVGAIRNADIKNRELERQGLLNKDGKLDG